jgi:flagellar hook-basal body complex protein FliE
MSIPGIGGASGIGQLAAVYRQQLLGGSTGVESSSSVGGPDPGTATRSADFASAIGDGLSNLQGLDNSASNLAVQAATGDLNDVQDYVIAANKVQLATDLTTTVRNKALESFNEIMRMPL